MDAGVPDGEIEQLQRRLVGRETAPGLDDFAKRPMQRLDRIGGVDHLADARREGEERHHMLPGIAPDLADRGVSLAPFSLELREPERCRFGALGPIDRLDRGQDCLAVLEGLALRYLFKRLRLDRDVLSRASRHQKTVAGESDVGGSGGRQRAGVGRVATDMNDIDLSHRWTPAHIVAAHLRCAEITPAAVAPAIATTRSTARLFQLAGLAG